MTQVLDAKAFQSRLERLDGLLRESERSADPSCREQTREIVQAILELHGAGLERLLEHVADAGESGAGILAACIRDETVSGLLLLHGLHPDNSEVRLEQALADVRPLLRSHGGGVELVSFLDGTVTLRLDGSCHSCPSSTATMRQTIEEAVYSRVPEVTAITLDGESELDLAQTNGHARMALPVLSR